MRISPIVFPPPALPLRVTASTSEDEVVVLRAAVTVHPASRLAPHEDLALLAGPLPELASLTSAELDQVLVGAEVFEVAAGDVLLKQGEIDMHAFFVLSGS